MSRESFFFLLAALGVAAGLAIFALLIPLRKAIGQNA
jgi:hypothetical protein